MVAVDLGYFADAWRFYGQVGITRGLTGDSEYDGQRETFAGAAATYYVNDNLAITGRLQTALLAYDRNPDDTERNLSWRSSIDYRPEGRPFILTASYRGFFWDRNDVGAPWEEKVTMHAVTAGIRVPFGATAGMSLKDQDRAYGLGLMSHYSGRFPENQ